jgi:folate-binding protein YgfZ
MMPLSTSVLAQHQALIHGAGMAEFSGRAEIEVAGRDRAAFLHNFCTADIKRLSSGEGSEAFFCNLQGKVLGHGYIVCRESTLVVDTVAGQAEALVKHLDRYLIREDVQFHDRSAAVGKLLVAGASMPGVIARLTGADPPQQRCGIADARIEGIDVSLRSVDFTGQDCWIVACDAKKLADVREALLAAGATACGPDAVEIARVEYGTPLYGRDISDKNLPQEIGRDERAISFNKGCYLGQETVARIDALGHVNRYLVGLKFAGDKVPEPGAALLTISGEPGASATGEVAKPAVGEVTSAVWSVRLSTPLALAYVRREHCRPGTRLSSDAGKVEVITLPVA